MSLFEMNRFPSQTERRAAHSEPTQLLPSALAEFQRQPSQRDSRPEARQMQASPHC